MTSFERPKERLLFFISLVYLISFSSLYIQLPGLFSRSGILPVDKLSISDAKTPQDFAINPNLIRLGNLIGLDKFDSLELVTIVGAIVSLLAVVFTSFRSFSTFSILWLCHYTCYSSGQTFLHFQWDILLLEAGFLAIFLARGDLILFNLPRHVPNDAIILFLFKWLLFRLMFASGVVKLTSHCPSWWQLNALNHHFETQCLPTPLAFYAHQIPQWILKLGVVTTFYVEILVPFMFFSPFKGLRIFSFYSQFLLQIAILLTGNYNFFNLLTLGLCYSLLTDSDLVKRKPVATGKKHKRQVAQSRSETSVMSHVICAVAILGSLMATVVLFQIEMHGKQVSAEIAFSKDSFGRFVNNSVLASCFVALICFVLVAYQSLKQSATSPGFFSKLYFTLGSLVMTLVGLILLFASMYCLSASLAPETVRNQPAAFGQVYEQLKPYHVSNSYGLFRRMTTSRNEVILEISDSEKGPWKQIQFHHKPGRTDKMPSIVAPHQPRLDWQMWFAALSSPAKQPWIYSLIHGILEARPEVLQLLDATDLKKAPKFVRANLVEYKFVKVDSLTVPQKWWTVTGKPSQYIPALSSSSKILTTKLTELGLLGTKNSAPSRNQGLSGLMRDLRDKIGQPKNLHPLLVVLLVLFLTKLRRS